MATARFISDTFWADPFVEDFSAPEKLMYIYLFTNPSATQCGFYQLSTSIMATQTGVERASVLFFLERLERAKKIVYEAGLIFIPSMARHQKASGKLFDRHVSRIARLHRSNGNTAFAAFIEQFEEELARASEAPS